MTFNKELFYKANDKLTTILVIEILAIIELLYKDIKVVNIGEAIKLPITKQDLSLGSSTKQQLRGKV